MQQKERASETDLTTQLIVFCTVFRKHYNKLYNFQDFVAVRLNHYPPALVLHLKGTAVLRHVGARSLRTGNGLTSGPHCLKITQNVAFEFLNFAIFHQLFVLLKLTCLVTLFDHKLHRTYQN